MPSNVSALKPPSDARLRLLAGVRRFRGPTTRAARWCCVSANYRTEQQFEFSRSFCCARLSQKVVTLFARRHFGRPILGFTRKQE
jgi:hypothetical protein